MNDHPAYPTIGSRVRVPTKSNPNRHWGATVIAVNGPFLKVKAGVSAGKPWWTHQNNLSNLKPSS